MNPVRSPHSITAFLTEKQNEMTSITSNGMSATELLEKSASIALLLPKEADESDMQEALVLACGLKKLGKHVSLEQTKQTSLHPSLPNEKTFIVSLKGLAPWIAKVRYEKDMKDLRLYFTLSRGEISPEALSLQVQSETDLTIIVGDKSAQHNDNSFEGALVLAADQTKKPMLELLRSHETPQARLLGAALSKLEYISRLGVYIVVLVEEDFCGIEAAPKLLPSLVAQLQESFGSQSSYVFLFDSSRGAQGFLWSLSPRLQKKFRDIAGGQQKNSWVLLRPTPLSSEQLKHAFLS